MDRFIAAFRFLTIFPVPGKLGTSEQDLAGSLPYFPVVGVVAGGAAALLGWCLWQLLPPVVAAVVMVLFLLAVSGGFHLDGLADCADGFFSARPRERMLEIMRDSHVGAMGVIALIMILLLKITALASLERHDALVALFLMPLAGRCLMVVVMALLPYVRQEGIATLFYKDEKALPYWALWAAGLYYCGLWYTAGIRGVGVGVFSCLAIACFIILCKAKIGGATGDVLGASCELAETAVALSFAVSFG